MANVNNLFAQYIALVIKWCRIGFLERNHTRKWNKLDSIFYTSLKMSSLLNSIQCIYDEWKNIYFQTGIGKLIRDPEIKLYVLLRKRLIGIILRLLFLCHFSLNIKCQNQNSIKYWKSYVYKFIYILMIVNISNLFAVFMM